MTKLRIMIKFEMTKSRSLICTSWNILNVETIFNKSIESLNNTGKLARIITCLLGFNGSQSIIFHIYDMKLDANFHKKNCFEGQL